MRTGVPCNENRVFPVRIYFAVKTLFWPCTDPVLDCSEEAQMFFFSITVQLLKTTTVFLGVMAEERFAYIFVIYIKNGFRNHQS